MSAASRFQKFKLPMKKSMQKFIPQKTVSKPKNKDLEKPMKNLVKSTTDFSVKEWYAVEQQESTLKNALSSKEGRLRGMRLQDLILNTSYFKHVNGQIELKLQHDYPLESTSRAFRQGNLVELVLAGSVKDQNWARVKGIISNVSEDSIFVQVQSIGDNFLLPKISQKDHFCIVDLEKRSSSHIMKMAVKTITKLKLTHLNENKLAKILNLPVEDSEKQVPVKPVIMQDNYLDEAKIKTLEVCSERHPITIIHGPPGTGKTTALAAVILSEIANGCKVLATAPSHAAVDALTIAIAKQWSSKKIGFSSEKMLRIGNKLRLKDPKVSKWLPKENLSLSISQELELLRYQMITAKEGKKELIEQETELMDKFQKAQRNEIFQQSKGNPVVISTCLTAMKMTPSTLKEFDLVCIDEAGFANDWLSIPLALSNIPRLILSGDHKQLPPISISNPLCSSLMERLINQVPTVTLNQQFRSNAKISEWSSQFFYDGKLTAHDSVAQINLNDLIGTQDQVLDCPMLFLDTAGLQYYEDKGDFDKSMCNFNEAYIVELIAKNYLRIGISPKDIGVITPYWSQVSVLREMFKGIDLEISTVDSFQGKEKELIIVSMVRSNPEKEVGFLAEIRRLNVTITRAKRCCVVVGDRNTLSNDVNVKRFIDFCHTNDIIYSVADFI